MLVENMPSKKMWNESENYNSFPTKPATVLQTIDINGQNNVCLCGV
jgi:hypothetical protein